MNYKGKYDSLECLFCDEEESQKHVMECKFINKNQNHENFPKYEEIFENNVEKQIKIARRFKQNMDIRKRLAKQ